MGGLQPFPRCAASLAGELQAASSLAARVTRVFHAICVASTRLSHCHYTAFTRSSHCRHTAITLQMAVTLRHTAVLLNYRRDDK